MPAQSTPQFRRPACGRIALVFAALVAAHGARAADWAPHLTLAGVWHDNATNATTSADQIDSLQLNADALASQQYDLGSHDALLFTGHAAGDWWPRYQELLGGALGGRAEWRHTFGVGTLAPVFSIEGSADAVLARDDGRSGTMSAVTVALRKRLNDHWRAAVQHELGRHDARHAVYDRTSSETSVELGYDATALTRLTLTARYRDGDIVSHATTPEAGVASIARVSQVVDTFDRPLVASSFEAKTWSGRAAFVRALDQSSAVVVAYEVRKTRASSVRFTNQLMSVSLVHQF